MAHNRNAVAAGALLTAIGVWLLWLQHESPGFVLLFIVAGLVSLIASVAGLCALIVARTPRPWSALPVSAVIATMWVLVLVSGVWHD